MLDSPLTRLARIVTLICLAVAAVGLVRIVATAPSAMAQDSLAIAAVVNDDVISVLDLSVRTRMVIVQARLNDTAETRNRLAPQVLRSLIDERLKVQEAEANGITISNQAVDARVDDVARQNNMSRQEFEQALMRSGILPEALKDQIRAELAWSTLIQRKLQPSVILSDEEVDEALADLQANLGKPEYRVAEIYLATDASNSDEQVSQTARRLAEQLRQGADFESLARQFSQSATAASGGDLGWIRPGQLDAEVEAAIRELAPGQIAGPLRSTGGYQILKLLDRRQTGSTSVLDGTASLKQAFIPLAADASAAEEEKAFATARSVVAQAASCADLDRLAREVNPQAQPDLANVRIGDLPDVLQPIVIDLPLSQPSEPIRIESGIGIFMVCERNVPEAGLPTREDIASSIRRERIDIMARGYLRDLRRAAYVDVRV